jgi:hypothetical protein
MSTRNEPSDIEQFDRNGSSSITATTVIRFASLSEVVSGASAVDLQVADGTLRVDCCEAVAISINFKQDNGDLTGSFLVAISARLFPDMVS